MKNKIIKYSIVEEERWFLEIIHLNKYQQYE